MNKRQQVEQAIREACPELQELKFGCVVSYEGMRHVVISTEDCDGLSIVLVTSEPEVEYVEEKDVKVIGSPIHLEHVMRALDGVIRGNDGGDWVEMYPTGGINYMVLGEHGEPRALYSLTYNLSLPFSDQSDELINFLHPILCGKE